MHFLRIQKWGEAYVVLDTKSREIFIFRDVVFIEETFVQLEDQNGRTDFEEDQSDLLYESVVNILTCNKKKIVVHKWKKIHLKIMM